MQTIYGFKLGQTQEFDAAGKLVPVTLVRVEPNVVVGWKTPEKDGYQALRVAFGTRKHPNKPLQGLLKNLPIDSAQGKSEKINPKFIREIKITDESEKKEIGTKITAADVFAAGDKVSVTGTSKGKGYAGVVKRHHFKGGPKTHGQSDRQRHPGSIGQTTTPGRVYKGKRMAGHLGAAQVTVKNLAVFAVKPEENLLLIKGLVPGARQGLVKISK